MNKNNIKDKMLNLMSYIVVTIFTLLCLYPFILLLTSSITDNTRLMLDGYSLLPKKLSLDAYKIIITERNTLNAFGVTVFTTVVGTLFSLIIGCALAYPLSLKQLKYKKGINLYIYFTMLFSGGLVPWYIMISKYLHMRNTIWVLIIPGLVNPFYVFLLRNFFKTIPDSLNESAKIDGANDIYILLKIIIPLSLPAMATVGLFYALDFWNEWFRALMFIEKSKLFPLQFIIMRIISNVSFVSEMFAKTGVNVAIPSYTLRLATVVVTIGPIILLYPFVQRYFVKGLTLGSVKG